MDEFEVQQINEVRCALTFDVWILAAPTLDGADGDVEIGGELADGHAGGREKLTEGHGGHGITSSMRPSQPAVFKMILMIFSFFAGSVLRPRLFATVFLAFPHIPASK